ncbi:hypothetical protein GDO81_016480 [Engystomops pustulosus]|uniref:Uncharacterized protein n=1 Tax=Engystomops pustulosus TaxID=76066 RepID=A0AAV7ATA0_ENGPU|nr:hypothetical protein GDO81_016480 [Engystomops pustulosus]
MSLHELEQTLLKFTRIVLKKIAPRMFPASPSQNLQGKKKIILQTEIGNCPDHAPFNESDQIIKAQKKT